jgi:hypothetical protein
VELRPDAVRKIKNPEIYLSARFIRKPGVAEPLSVPIVKSD